MELVPATMMMKEKGLKYDETETSVNKFKILVKRCSNFL